MIYKIAAKKKEKNDASEKEVKFCLNSKKLNQKN